MRRRLATVALTVVLALSLSGTVARAQTSLPPDIRAITQKAKAGQELTEAEEQRLEEWLEGQQQVAPSKRAPGPAGAVGTAESAAGHPAVCPSGQPATLPANAPTPGEYTKLLNALAATHGPRAGETRGDVDRVFAARSASAAGSEVGALLHVAGADEASVYASATAARQRPFDPVLANNLGVALTALGNHRAAAQVLLYAGRLQPGAALVELNLGWAYFGAGQLASAEKQFQRACRSTATWQGRRAASASSPRAAVTTPRRCAC